MELKNNLTKLFGLLFMIVGFSTFKTFVYMFEHKETLYKIVTGSSNTSNSSKAHVHYTNKTGLVSVLEGGGSVSGINQTNTKWTGTPAILAVPPRIYINSNQSCVNLMTGGRFFNNSWKPPGCAMHDYNHEDLNTCLQKLSSQKKSNFYIAYLGDSRVRQRWRALTGFLKHEPFKYIQNHNKLTYTNTTTGTQVDFFWQPTPQQMIQFLNKWDIYFKKNPPDVFMLGFLTHLTYTRLDESYQEKYKDYVSQMGNLIKDITKRYRNTQFIWMSQDPFGNVKSKGKVTLATEQTLYKQAMEKYGKSFIGVYNDLAANALKNITANIVIYAANTQFTPKYFNDYINFRHIGPKSADLDRQILFNYLCNSMIHTIPPEVCCRQKP